VTPPRRAVPVDLAARGGTAGALAAVAAAGALALAGRSGTAGELGVLAGAALLLAWLALPPTYAFAAAHVLFLGVGTVPTPVVVGFELAALAVLLAPAAAAPRRLAGIAVRLGSLLVAGVVAGVAWLRFDVAGAAAALVALGLLGALLVGRTRVGSARDPSRRTVAGGGP
jgi:hypothetical protein